MSYTLGEPYTYQKAQKFCTNNGMELCSRAQYCIGGKGGRLFGSKADWGEMASGDKWAPVSDNTNSWVETGTAAAHKQCWTHTEVGHGRPGWGTTGLGRQFGRKLCCAGDTKAKGTAEGI